MNQVQAIRDFVRANPGCTSIDIAKAIGCDTARASARMSMLAKAGEATSTVGSHTLSKRPVHLWTMTAATQPSKREYVSSPKVESSLDALIESMAEGLVAALVTKVKAKLPVALAGVSPATHLTMLTAPQEIVASVVLPPPEPAPEARTVKPRIGVVGLLPQQAGILQEKFGQHIDLVFWKDDGNAKLKAMAEGCEVVFLHTRHCSHANDQMLKLYKANIRRVTGGVSNMELTIRAYFESKESV